MPAVPDLDLPVPSDPDLLLAIATVVAALGLMGLMTGWVEKQLSHVSLLAALIGAALFFWVWETDRESFGWIALPEAFIELVARVLR
ncbi:hypothetical protein SAMN05444004_103154 [Jannaschia faecimaris]|uniref:Uncharacterized protein n=1 Tax=Jannaschia faecimaris TaxID=1244108 RepID=A0A1H3MSA6_9RHOB|nr:hypothetical protein [Jannaschia faecimaris]SDY79403.1 hypothetical protein SAMN05444004_103154 [Jannaschia faecimaris]